jgi:hypothetical protein
VGRERSAETAPGPPAPATRRGGDEPLELQRAAGNRATSALATRSPTAAIAGDLRRAGNAGLARLLDPPAAAPPASAAAAVSAPSDLRDLQSIAAADINELSIAHDLQRAIDQRQEYEAVMHGKGRKVNFPLVDHVLTGLSPSQLQKVFAEYTKETGRALRDDLLGGSVPAELNEAQRARIQALLAGTALETGRSLGATGGLTMVAVSEPGSLGGLMPGALGYADAAAVIARNRAFADAAQLKLLLDAGDAASTKQILTLLRRSASANDMTAAAYERQFEKKLDPALAGLGGLTGERALALRYGIPNRADALALEAVRRRIEEFDRKRVFSLGPMTDPRKLEEERRAMIAEAEAVLATIAEEASAESGSSSAAGTRAAVAERLAEVLAIRIPDGDDPGKALGDLLGDTFKGDDLAVLGALRTGDPVEAAAARIVRADADDKVDLKLMSATLRDLRASAEREVGREAKAKADALKHAGLAPDQLAAAAGELMARAQAEVEARAKLYVARLTTRVDQLGEKADRHRWAELLEALDKDDGAVIDKLVARAGTLLPIDALEEAMRQKDLVTAARVIHELPPSQRRDLVKQYDSRASVSLETAVAGRKVKLGIGGDEIQLPRTDNEAAIAELIEAPEPGGEMEFAWTAKWTRLTYERGLQEGGVVGAFEDLGGREVRDLMNATAVEVTDAHIAYRKAQTPEETEAALRQLRNAREAMTGDKSAYVAETDAIRASIANAIATAVDIALTIMMPETAGFVSKMVASLAANIGSKLLVLQDKYSPDMLKADLIGAVVSMGVASPSKLAGEEATKLVGSKLAGAAEQYGWKVSAEMKALAPGLTKLGGNIVSNAATTAETNIALGKSWDDDLLSSTATGVVKGYGTDFGRTVVHGTGTATASSQGGEQAAPRGEEGGPARPGEELEPAAGTRPAEEPAVTAAPAPSAQDADIHTRPTRELEAVKAPDEEANPGAPSSADDGAPPPERTPMALPEDGKKNDFETEEPTQEGPSMTWRDEPTAVHDTRAQRQRAVGDCDQPMDVHDPIEAYRMYQAWRRDGSGREVSLIYNFMLDEWAVVQGERSTVDVNAAYKRLGWKPEESVLERHPHPAREEGVTPEANLHASGVREDFGVYEKDAAKREGTHLSAIDVVVLRDGQPVADRVLVSYDTASKTWKTNSPLPKVAGREVNVFSSYKQYHEWFFGRFGTEPSKTKILDLPAPGSTDW